MQYAEVAVDAPIGYDRTLSYRIPADLDLEPGQMAWVPLGTKPVQGIVFQFANRPQVAETKDVIASVGPSPILPPQALELARWISHYYMSSLFDAAALMLPPGFESRVRAHISASTRLRGVTLALRPRAKEVLDLLDSRGEMRESKLGRSFGKDAHGEVRWLLNSGLVERRWELLRPRTSHRYDCHIRPVVPTAIGEVPAAPSGDRAPKQLALYRALTVPHRSLPLSTANKSYGPGAVSALLAKGLVALEWTRVEREPALQREKPGDGEAEIVLTSEQERALEKITCGLKGNPGHTGPFLLHGVTGSGKTEVYLRALRRCVEYGKRGIFLLPEISLTPQTVHRLNARFPGRVALLHSGLPIGEQFDQWWRIKDGDYDVVVGPRSALFAPVPDLGLIVLDEEHEWTYKQQDSTPRYHAREVALRLAELAGAVVVMGSATPDVESYYKAKGRRYTLLELPRRVSSSSIGREGAAELAQVEVCDMRRELKDGNRSIFSRALAGALRRGSERGEQAILFLNRRGSATLVQCRDCGHALRCRRCSVTLTYHAPDMSLRCHQCNRRSRLPRHCPQCRSPRIRYLGLGTQRVVEELRRLIPNVTTLRWDRDTAHTPRAHELIMRRFLQGEAQVLVGTQMVAKGLHVPSVTLVGVILADIGLNLPDFRAGERAFQLLCQVAGRAGRGGSPGRVIVQTYNPSHYAVEAAAGQDYGVMYSNEIRFRERHGNPPFNQLVHMTYLHTSPEVTQREAEKLGRVLRRQVYTLGLTDVETVGPAPAFPERVRGRYRWHVILRGRNLRSFLEGITIPQGWTVDVDPVSVL